MKSKNIKRSVLLIVGAALAFMQQTFAQTDPHFTQNYTYPLYVNPAMTGGGNGEYRVSTVYRSQWGSLGNPYRTTGVSFDKRTNKNIALGANILNQAAGDGGFNYLTAYASVAYTGVKFGKGEHQRVVFAMQGGIINRRFDQSKFKWGEQWNPVTGYNASNPTSETFARDNATTLDLGAGALYYDATPDKKMNAFAGLSFFHLNRPSDPIISAQSVELNTIPLRYTLHGGISYTISEEASIVPHALYMQQGNAREIMLGLYVQQYVNAETEVMLGGYYRYNDAIAPFVGLDYKNFLIGLSYDVNASKLSTGTKMTNSFELSLSYTHRKGTKSFFDFIRCPRL